MFITSPIGLIPFPVGVSVASPALRSDRLCHDNVGYVKTKQNKKQTNKQTNKTPDFRKLADFEK